jgi:hypothetical protein
LLAAFAFSANAQAVSTPAKPGGGHSVSAASVIEKSLRQSSLIYGKKPFHLVMAISPGKNATDDMQGSVEVFWVSSTRYKAVIVSPTFAQTRIVVGPLVEEKDNGDFYPRWLENFVQSLFLPISQVDDLKKQEEPRGSAGMLFTANGQSFRFSRCVNKSDRPGGITEETSIASVCIDGGNPFITGTADFTRIMSFKDFKPFGKQWIARQWIDDIPQNIFVQGAITTLEPLSRKDMSAIKISQPTSLAAQIHTAFVSRAETETLLQDPPAFDWPAENTEALEGYMIVYVRTDRTGHVRESYWDSSDNYKLQNAGVELALKTQFKPLIRDGVAVQMEGPFVLHFKTHRDPDAPDPMPPSKAYLP